MAIELIEKLKNWFPKQPDITGALLVGSHARGAARPESDVDLVILTENKISRIEDKSWLADFGMATSTRIENFGVVTSIFVRFQTGPEIEFGFASPSWAQTDPVDKGTFRVVSDGAIILFDSNGALGRLLRAVNLK